MPHNDHKYIRRKSPGNRVIIRSVTQQLQPDLVDMQSLSFSNNEYSYLLTCIEILSKNARVIQSKDKKVSGI